MVAFIRTGRVAGVFLLLSLAACGGRTTGDLASDGYDTGTGSSVPSDAGAGGGKGATAGSPSTGASTSTGASSSVGGSGQAGAPSEGGGPSTGGSSFGQSGSAGSTDTSGFSGAAAVACVDLCLDPDSPCPDEFGPGAQCATDCMSALGVQNGACQTPGIQWVTCLMKAARQFDCSSGQTQAVALCSEQGAAFQSCATGGNLGTSPASGCSGSASADAGKCSLSQACVDGKSFDIECVEATPDRSACTCSSGGVTATLTLNESVSFACNDALSACNGPTLPK